MGTHSSFLIGTNPYGSRSHFYAPPIEEVIIKQDITLCPGHDYALSFDIVGLACPEGINWQAFAAGQRLGGASNYVLPSGGARVGPLTLSALPTGPKGSGTPGSADYNGYQYDADGTDVYTQVAVTFQCAAPCPNCQMVGVLDNFSMYQTD